MSEQWLNKLYFGDNLEILQGYVGDETVDLVYLDPPFNSNAAYNVLFAEKNGSQAAAQIRAFDDTWHWDLAAAEAYEGIVERGDKVADALIAFRRLLGDNDMMAYLTMMAPRLVQLRRVLKPTGSLYLHCDPTASHYLKVVMDAVFGAQSYRNEIIWKRQSAHSDATRYGSVHDTLLYYSKGDSPAWNKVYQPYDPDYVDRYYRYKEDDGRCFKSGDLSAYGLQGGGYEYEWNGHEKLWRCPRETMQRLHDEGKLYYTKNGIARIKQYLDEAPGMPPQDLWCDVQSLRSWHKERLGYQTQKPEALLERAIQASSSEGDLVLDPFCGCGTTVAAAQKLNRRWLGIDITYLSIALVRRRLDDSFGEAADYEVIGEPTSVPDAGALAQQDPYQFQWWALDLVGARPADEKKGADRGIDGRLYFHDEPAGGETKLVVISVKSGHTSVRDIRDLAHVVERENAAIGVLITMQESTQPMRTEAAGAGFYTHEASNTHYPRVQILTIAELLEGKHIERPYAHQPTVTFKKAPRAKGKRGKQKRIDLDQ